MQHAEILLIRKILWLVCSWQAQELSTHISSAIGKDLDNGTLLVHRGRVINWFPPRKEILDAASEEMASLITNEHVNGCFLDGGTP